MRKASDQAGLLILKLTLARITPALSGTGDKQGTADTPSALGRSLTTTWTLSGVAGSGTAEIAPTYLHAGYRHVLAWIQIVGQCFEKNAP